MKKLEEHRRPLQSKIGLALIHTYIGWDSYTSDDLPTVNAVARYFLRMH